MTQPNRSPWPRTVSVLRTEHLNRSLVRVVVAGPELAGFHPTHADSYVKLLFPPPPDAPGSRPRLRTYTVRSFDPISLELTLDFVVHGDGLAGPWATSAFPGDQIQLLGPGGSYTPDPKADFHVLAGDEIALPAIAVALERLPTGARGHAFIDVRSHQDELDLGRPITWLHRGDDHVGRLVETITGWQPPQGDGQWFVHGEATMVRQIRQHLLDVLGVPRTRTSISGYWRRGVTDEQWRATKSATAQIMPSRSGAPSSRIKSSHAP